MTRGIALLPRMLNDDGRHVCFPPSVHTTKNPESTESPVFAQSLLDCSLVCERPPKLNLTGSQAASPSVVYEGSRV